MPTNIWTTVSLLLFLSIFYANGFGWDHWRMPFLPSSREINSILFDVIAYAYVFVGRSVGTEKVCFLSPISMRHFFLGALLLVSSFLRNRFQRKTNHKKIGHKKRLLRNPALEKSQFNIASRKEGNKYALIKKIER